MQLFFKSSDLGFWTTLSGYKIMIAYFTKATAKKKIARSWHAAWSDENTFSTIEFL